MISSIIGGIFGLVENWQDERKATKERKGRIEEAKTNAKIKDIERGNTHAETLDQISLKTRGIKDEYLLFLITLPLIGVFHPDLVPHIQSGFSALKELPEFYLYGLGLVFVDTFGFRRLLRAVLIKKGDKWLN